MTAPTDALVERLRALQVRLEATEDAWKRHVEAVGRLNAAIPEIEATPAERALYGERYKAKDVAEREMRAATMRCAEWCAEFEAANSIFAVLARIEAAEKVLEPLLKGWAAFTDDGTGWGNHEEAYQCLAKGMDEHWSAAAQWQAGQGGEG